MLPGNAAVFLALVCSLPQVLPILKTFLLDSSFGVCRGHEGIAAPVEGLCCALYVLQVVCVVAGVRPKGLLCAYSSDSI